MVESQESQEKLSVRIVSTIQYAGRILGVIEVSVPGVEFPYRTSFYQSTGSNVESDKDWFPFAGVSSPNALKRTGMHTGWIIKDLLYSTKGQMKLLPTMINGQDHGVPELRLTCFGETPFDVPEVAKLIKDEYSKQRPLHIAALKHPIEQEDAQFINTWLTKAILVAKDIPNDDEILDEVKTRELYIRLATMV